MPSRPCRRPTATLSNDLMASGRTIRSMADQSSLEESMAAAETADGSGAVDSSARTTRSMAQKPLSVAVGGSPFSPDASRVISPRAVGNWRAKPNAARKRRGPESAERTQPWRKSPAPAPPTPLRASGRRLAPGGGGSAIPIFRIGDLSLREVCSTCMPCYPRLLLVLVRLSNRLGVPHSPCSAGLRPSGGWGSDRIPEAC